MNHATPNEAAHIAAHTAEILRAIRSANSATAVKQLGDIWFSWAKSNGVCQAIRDSVGSAVSEMATRHRVESRRASEETTKRMTGERDA